MGTPVRDGGIGAAVGVIVGILLGAACVWLYFGKRRRPQTCEDKPEPEPVVALGACAPYAMYSLQGPGSIDLANDFRMVSSTIESIGRGCYHREALAHIPDSFDESLRRLGLEESVTSNIKSLLIEPNTRRYAIVHLLARVIWTSLDIHTIGPLSLLPPFVTDFIPNLPYSFKDFDGKNLAPLNAWRTLSTYLMQENRIICDTLKPPPSIDPQIERLSKALEDALGIFYKQPKTTLSHREYLELIIRDCAVFGYVLFSHKHEWQFTWETEPSPDAITIIPGLAQLTNAEGEPYATPEFIDKFPEIVTPGPWWIPDKCTGVMRRVDY